MKYLVIVFCVLISIVTFTSCDDDETDGKKLDNIETYIKYEISCNNPIAHVKVWEGNDPIIIGHWEESFKTKAYFVGLSAECLDDSLATVTIKIYRNGKLYIQDSAQGYAAKITCRIKGNELRW